MASEVIDRARASYRERAWAAAYADFHAADDESPLAIDDLEQLAVTAYFIGKDDHSLELWARAHRECLRLDDAERAARCGFWLAFHLLLRGDIARSGGWVARIQRQLDCAVQGYVMVVNGLVALDADDVDHAYALFTRATDIADRFTDPDLSAIARLSTGEALIQRHEVAQGVRLLDEVMAGVITDEVSPVVVGVLYCATILCCQKIFDIRRETGGQQRSLTGAPPNRTSYRSAASAWCTLLAGYYAYWSGLPMDGRFETYVRPNGDSPHGRPTTT